MFTNTGSVYRAPECPCCRMLWGHPERRHGSIRVPGHAFLAWRSSRGMVGYIYYVTSAGNSISSQPGRSYSQGPEWFGKGSMLGPSITYKITPVGSLSFSQPGGPPSWTSPLAFGLIGATRPLPCERMWASYKYRE